MNSLKQLILALGLAETILAALQALPKGTHGSYLAEALAYELEHNDDELDEALDEALREASRVMHKDMVEALTEDAEARQLMAAHYHGSDSEPLDWHADSNYGDRMEVDLHCLSEPAIPVGLVCNLNDTFGRLPTVDEVAALDLLTLNRDEQCTRVNDAFEDAGITARDFYYSRTFEEARDVIAELRADEKACADAKAAFLSSLDDHIASVELGMLLEAKVGVPREQLDAFWTEETGFTAAEIRRNAEGMHVGEFSTDDNGHPFCQGLEPASWVMA